MAETETETRELRERLAEAQEKIRKLEVELEWARSDAGDANTRERLEMRRGTAVRAARVLIHTFGGCFVSADGTSKLAPLSKSDLDAAVALGMIDREDCPAGVSHQITIRGVQAVAAEDGLEVAYIASIRDERDGKEIARFSSVGELLAFAQAFKSNIGAGLAAAFASYGAVAPKGMVTLYLECECDDLFPNGGYSFGDEVSIP